MILYNMKTSHKACPQSPFKKGTSMKRYLFGSTLLTLDDNQECNILKTSYHLSLQQITKCSVSNIEKSKKTQEIA